MLGVRTLYVCSCILFTFCNSILSLKNVMLIIVDDLRPALGCYQDKNAYTPNIDALAERSIIFNNAYAQQALCAPSRNSFLTSRRPDTLHLYDFYSYWRTFSGNFTSLPQHFRENGYFTASFGKVFHPGVSSNWSDDQPYSWSQEPFHPQTQKYMNAQVCRGSDGYLHRNLVCPVVTSYQPKKTLPDLETTKAVKMFLKTLKQNAQLPFLIAVGFHKPHVPLKFPKEYLDFHPLDDVKIPEFHYYPPLLPTVAWNPWTDVRKRDDIIALNISFPFGYMPGIPNHNACQIFSQQIKFVKLFSAHYTKLIRQSYYGAVTYVDDLIGQVIKELQENGFANDTVIILIGDHGWSMAEHGEWSKFSNYDISVRVPMILHVPGITDHNTRTLHYSGALVELVDIFPTLVELTNVSSSLSLCPKDSKSIKLCTEGLSLLPVIQHEMENKAFKRKRRMEWKKGAFSQYPRPGCFPTERPNSDKPHLKQIKIMGYSLRTERHRYTEWVSFNPQTCTPKWSEVIGLELYDHYLDPEENLNLADRQELQYIVTKLSMQLRAGWRESLPTHVS